MIFTIILHKSTFRPVVPHRFLACDPIMTQISGEPTDIFLSATQSDDRSYQSRCAGSDIFLCCILFALNAGDPIRGCDPMGEKHKFYALYQVIIIIFIFFYETDDEN